MVSERWGWYRQACDEADAERLRQKRPGYHVGGGRGAWNAVHLDSRDPFGPFRTVRRLAAAIEADAWTRPAVTVRGTGIAIRASGQAWPR